MWTAKGAFRGTWTSPHNPIGAGIIPFYRWHQDHDPDPYGGAGSVMTTEGGMVGGGPGGGGKVITKPGDPLIDDQGHVVFTATLRSLPRGMAGCCSSAR
jgi:hypothetical protein